MLERDLRARLLLKKLLLKDVTAERERHIYDLFKNELLIQELARRIVVLHRKLRTRESVIVRQHVEQRYRGLPLGDVKIADLDHDRLGRPRERCKRKKHRGYRENRISGRLQTSPNPPTLQGFSRLNHVQSVIPCAR